MGCKKVEEALSSVFRWYGELVARRPFPFLVVPLLVTLIVGPGLLTMQNDDDAMLLFTPKNAPSRREQQIARQFARTSSSDRNSSDGKFALPMSSDHDPYVDKWFLVQVLSSDNLMNQQSWEAISRFVNDIYDNFTCQVDDWIESDVITKPKRSASGPPYTLKYGRDFCNPARGCMQLNTVVDQVRDLLNETKYGNHSKVRLTYPVMYVWNRPFNWGQYIWGVKVDPDSGKLLSARVLGLYLQLQVQSNARGLAAGDACIRQLTQYVKEKNDPEVQKDNLTFNPINEPLLADEVTRIQEFSIPYLVGCVILIILFIAISSFKRRFVPWCCIGACVGVLTVGLSLLVSFGFLSMCGVHMNFVVAITPFLVLCVGIDNDFLITSAWRQTADGQSSLQRRMGRAFADCGPSLTITSVNDVLCFGVGYLSETPAVSDFCLHTCVSLLFRFIFQLTFFAAITVYLGRREMAIDANFEDTHNSKNPFRSLFLKSASVTSVEALPAKQYPQTLIDFSNFKPVNDVFSVPKKEHHRIHDFFGARYAPFLMRRSVRLVSSLIYIVYILSAVYGAATWFIEITPQKLFFDDSILQKSLGVGELHIRPEVMIGRVYVTAPPDFRYKANIIRFLQFVDDLENLDNSNFSRSSNPKSDQTDLWLRKYLDFYGDLRSTDSDDGENAYWPDFYDYLPDFLESADYNRFSAYMRFKGDAHNQSAEIRLDKFQFAVSYFRSREHGFVIAENIEMLLKWRAVCQNYSEYQAVVFDHFQFSAYYDQRLTLAPTCLQTMGIALLCMSVVTALLMPHVRSMFFICLSFLSVDVGVIAGLHLWNCPLDPTSMAFVLMTIGFSVYYTARVCYCYQSASGLLTSEEKMRNTMETVGWPILQGALATMVGIIPIALIPSYMMRVFYRTVILIVLIGLAHGLLIMPILMTAFDRSESPVRKFQEGAKRSRRKIKGEETTPDTLSEYSSH